MAIYDGEVVITPPTAEQVAEAAAEKIFKIANSTLDGLSGAMKRIKAQLQKGGGKAAVVAQISAEDVTELTNFYNAIKNVVETYSPIVPDDL